MFAHTIGWLLKLNQYRVVEIWVGREYCNCNVTRGGVCDEILPGPEENHGGGARDFPRAQTIFHRIPRLESQFSHSQLPLLANIFLYWLRELAIFSCIGFVSYSIVCEYKDPYWASSTGQIFSCIANLRTLAWQLQKFTKKYTLSRKAYCNSYFSVFHC